MSIYTLVGINKNQTEITKCSQKQAVKTEKERKEASIFAKQLAAATGESIHSKNIQDTIQSSKEGASLEELLGVYINKTGKSNNAKVTDKNGQQETLAIKELSVDELKAVAKGDLNPLKDRDAQVRQSVKETTGKKSKKEHEAKDATVTAENQARPEYKNVMFGTAATKGSMLKTVKSTDSVQEFAQTMKSVTEMQDEKTKAYIQNADINSREATKNDRSGNIADGEKLINSTQKTIEKINKDIELGTQNRREFVAQFGKATTRAKTKHSKNEVTKKSADQKQEKVKKNVSSDMNELAQKKVQSYFSNNKTASQKQTNPIKTAVSGFLGLTQSKTVNANSNISQQNTAKVSAAKTENAKAANVINNGISKANEAQITLKDNVNVINDTATKASQANNYAEFSENLVQNAIIDSTQYDEAAQIMQTNAIESQKAAAINESNSNIYTDNAKINEKAAASLSNQSSEAKSASKDYRTLATEQAKAAMDIKTTTEKEFQDVSLGQLLATQQVKECEEDIEKANKEIEHGHSTKKRGARYEKRGRICIDIGVATLALSTAAQGVIGVPCAIGGALIGYALIAAGAVLMRKGHNIDKHGRTQINRGEHKLQRAEIAKMEAENKIAEAQRYEQTAQKDAASSKTLKEEAKVSTQKSQTLEITSQSLKSQSEQQKNNQKVNEKAASSFANVAQNYKDKAHEQEELASLNAAFADDKKSQADEYSSKAAVQKNIGLKLDSVAQKQENKQEEMAEKVQENISKNEENVKKFNENDKAGSKKEPVVEKFHKQKGAEETEVKEENENVKETDDVAGTSAKDAKNYAENNTDNSQSLIGHADRTFKSHLVFGAPDRQQDAKDNENEKTENIEEQENNKVENSNESNNNQQNEEQNQLAKQQEMTANINVSNLNIKKLG